MWLLLAILIAIYPVTILIECLIETHRRRARYRALLRQWSAIPEVDREKLIVQWLERNPRCGAGWYLQGVLHLRSRRMRHAARAFGMAHHCDANLVSAALFTFVCLKIAERDFSDIHGLIQGTWVEMRRPLFGQSMDEGLVLDALADGPNPASSNWTLERLTALVLSGLGTDESVKELNNVARAV